jgi:hypothetical protein
MKTRILFLMVLVCALASMANALDIRYMGSGPWETTANWQGGVMPGVADAARFNWGDNTVTVSTAVGTVDRIQAGVDEPGTLHILSCGTATSGTWTGAGVAGNCIGTINIDAGGTLNTGAIVAGGGHLWVAMNDSGLPYGLNRGIVNLSGTINLTGNIGLGTLNAVTPSGGVGLINVLDGGLLNLHHWGPLGSIQPGSLLSVFGTGLVTLPGDHLSEAQAYIDIGRIVGVAHYDGDDNVTYIGAIPEPISISLLGLGALALLRKRS